MIGFIGLGNMGKHMARNLLRNGLKVMAFDTNQLKLAEIQACGGEVARDVREVALKCQKVITMLPNSSHVKKVFVAENGLLRSMRPGLVCIDSSTIDQNITVEIATEVHAKGGHFFDAPVSGGVVGAEKATLTFMIGGDPNHFDMVADILRFLGQNIVYCGKVGSGQAAKICNNMLLAIEMIGVAEAMNLGINMGLEGKKLASIINSSSGRCWSSDSYNPVPDIIDGVPSSNNYSGGFGVSLMAKDLSLAQNASTLTGCPTPLGSVAHQLYRILAKVPEYSDLDFSVIYQYLKK